MINEIGNKIIYLLVILNKGSIYIDIKNFRMFYWRKKFLNSSYYKITLNKFSFTVYVLDFKVMYYV